MPKVEAELNRLEKEGIIEKVDKPTDWRATMVHVLKKNGNVRIRVDLKKEIISCFQILMLFLQD